MITKKSSAKEAFVAITTTCLYLLMAIPAMFLGEDLGEAIIQHRAPGGIQGLLAFLLSLPLAMIAFCFVFRVWLSKSRKNQIIGTVVMLLFTGAILSLRVLIYFEFELSKN
jgi:hypothetical protein